MISFWSVLSATSWFVLATVLLCVLRGHTDFLMRHGATAWSVAVVLTIVRLLLPLDSEHMIVLRSYKVLPKLRRALNYQPLDGVSVRLILKGFWAAGTVLGIAFVVYGIVRDRRRLQRLPAAPLSPPVRAAMQTCGLGAEMVCVTPVAITPMVTGFLHPTIYLPADAYSEGDLVWILKHEMSHIAGHDAWLRLGFLLFRCLFWWNPFVHLAQRSVDDILELRCDKAVLDGLAAGDRVDYGEALCHVGRLVRQDALPLVGAGTFVQPSRAGTLALRVRMALDDPRPWDRKVLAAFVLSLALFAVSYVFILQPAGLPPPADDVSVFVISPETAYLVKISDDEYQLWCNGECLHTIRADELNEEWYQNLEVRP